MRIAVVGSGYVGLVAGACFADLGHEIILVDNDEQKLAALNQGQVPIHENFLPELLGRHRRERMKFSNDLKEAAHQSSVIFVTVGTPPTERGEADLSYVESVAREISGGIDSYKVIVEKSTVPVYTSEWIRRIILRNGIDPELFDVASNPEFLREGTAVTDFLFPDRIVIGCDSERSANVLRQIYAPLTDGSYYERTDAIPQPDRASIPPPIIVTSTKSAELIKHASNAFLAMKISFINAVASVCESVEADVNQVVHGIGSDSRIGSRFLNPGIGYGGSCFPKDVMAFKSVARESGYDFRLLEEVMRINEEQRQRFLRKVHRALWTLRGKNLAVLGLAFKGGTDDIRESPAIFLVQALLQEGCKITAYDPAAMERAQKLFQSGVTFAKSAYDAASGADALLILTEWEEFANLDLQRLRQELKFPIVIDGRNLYDPDVMAAHGFTYYSVGRVASHPDGVPAAALKNGKKA
ncbi:MAG TPA: UDP-glucose/GDP-mannose dehydrogenase family protein [Candidatus Sulfotelmatobacter sp.]|jgi:UDPglucose 6-dehydrogenase|nr:UDP-glucose/GDP-mannose dehydrogenase family protein [Candidatus Sulfotelmatobacter sp.]